MDQTNFTDGTCSYYTREVVGVFADPDALEAAVDELQVAGFDRATVSVLPRDKTVKERVGHLYDAVREVEDEGHIPQGAFASRDSLIEGEAAAVGIPIYILGCVGAVAAVASGAALAGTIAGGAAGAGLGGLLARAIARRHRDYISEQLARGGMVLWASPRDDKAERRALRILKEAGARDVHVHEVEREWTLKDRPLSEVQFDPFLWWPSGDRPSDPRHGLDS